MPRTIIVFVSTISMFLFISSVVQAAGPINLRPGEDQTATLKIEEEEVNITGYGDIDFGSSIYNLRTTTIVGIEFANWRTVNDDGYQSFTILDKTLDAFTVIGSLDNSNSTVSIINIVINFPITMDLDDVATYVMGIKTMYTTKYPQPPSVDNWVWGYDSYYSDWWVGDLQIDDSDGDCVWINWDGYTVGISYRNADYQQAVWDNAVDSMIDQQNKI